MTLPSWPFLKTSKEGKMGEYLVVLTTTEEKADARKIASTLVEERLAACVQIMPIESFYRWKGKIENSGEYLCLIKTTSSLYPALEKRLKEIHPYETPEIIALSIVKGSEDYLAWLTQSIS